MTLHDKDDFYYLLAQLWVIYEREPDEIQARFYWDTLKDLELAELKTAAVAIAKSSKWFPKPAELRTAVFEQRQALRQAQDAALLAMPADLADHCEQCSDTGWQPTADGVTACACRPTNPVYQRRMVHVQAAAAAQGPTAEEAPKVLRAVERGAKDFRQLAAGDNE